MLDQARSFMKGMPTLATTYGPDDEVEGDHEESELLKKVKKGSFFSPLVGTI